MVPYAGVERESVFIRFRHALFAVALQRPDRVLGGVGVYDDVLVATVAEVGFVAAGLEAGCGGGEEGRQHREELHRVGSCVSAFCRCRLPGRYGGARDP